ncbi:hydrogen peroxide-inducible genes activator [soil metagenome]
MMIQKLEEELKVKIFDRSKQPVVPTEVGQAVIGQARRVLAEVARVRDLVGEHKNEVRGELRLGIIPTVAPFLLPLFLNDFLEKYPQLKIIITELTTELIVEKLQRGELDAGILATPLQVEALREIPLYNEEFVVYASGQPDLLRKKYVLPADLDLKRLWLLKEGHCLRSQIVSLCELKKQERPYANLEYEAGSIDSLKRLVESNKGITILPELAVLDFTEKEKEALRFFKRPVPVREISLVTYRHYIKERLLQILQEEIVAKVSPLVGRPESFQVIGVGPEPVGKG